MRALGVLSACVAVAVLQAVPVFANDQPSPAKVAVYFAAHEDDWQLFMTPAAFEDAARDNTKAVFVHLTAGDAGLGVGNGGRKHPLYLARENGAEAAIRFMANKDYDTPPEKAESYVTIHGHQIYRMSYRNTVAYFLRLPDGSPEGTGYEHTGFQSLNRLAAGEINTLTAVDGSAAYRGWTDLVTVIRTILDYERDNAPTVAINIAEPDPAINPGDHSDHLMTAQAVLDAAASLTCAHRIYYVDYASSHLPENLNSQQRDMASSVFAVTLAGVLALDHTVAWHRYDRSYVGRSYFRVEEGNDRCEPAGPMPKNVMDTTSSGRPAGLQARR